MFHLRGKSAAIAAAIVLMLAAATAARANSERVLYTFTGGADGADPFASLIIDSNGNLYGTTSIGGLDSAGVVFKLSPRGRETVLYSFTGGSDGAFPDGGVMMDANGNFYGTTFGGGVDHAGVVFKLSPRGRETVLYSFTGGNDGAGPEAGLISDANGNFYGTTVEGGVDSAGVVFKLSPKGRETVLHSFTGGDDGAQPLKVDLVRDAQGNLYGTTSQGGAHHGGVVFKLSSTGRETVLHTFTGLNDGGAPDAGLITDANGNFYGTTFGGGLHNAGVVFKLSATKPCCTTSPAETMELNLRPP